uniref:Uncharacterized protein n=1 Tax=Anguilla anguilla TaxID=7936 RepID=A0A0E9S4B2_ANGAN
MHFPCNLRGCFNWHILYIQNSPSHFNEAMISTS